MMLAMTAQIINGKKVAQDLQNEIRQKILERAKRGLRPPGLAVILVGNDPASKIYVHHKRENCHKIGMKSIAHDLPENTTESELSDLIATLNQDPSIDGILVQSPLPKHINEDKIVQQIAIEKDVDGFHPFNMGRLAQRRLGLRPCTPKGVMTLLNHIETPLKGMEAVMVGASNIVGRPMTLELLNAGCTITTCHRFTQDLEHHVRRAELLIVAIGNPNIIQTDWIKKEAIVIDIGMNRMNNGKLRGDIDFDSAKHRASWITPVPGGVGPMTVATLLQNTLIAAERGD